MTVRMGYDIATTASEQYDAPVKFRRRNCIRIKRQTTNKTVTLGVAERRKIWQKKMTL